MAQAEAHRVNTSFSEELMEMMRDELQPELGTSDSQMIRHVVIAWLSEHGYLEAQRGDELEI